MKTEHTKLPWKFDDTWHLILGPEGQEIAALHSAQGPDEKRATRFAANLNADFIIQACNAHEQLIEALRQCKAAVEDGSLPPSARLELVRDIATPILNR